MRDDMIATLAAWVKSGPGRRWFEGIGREARSKEAAVSERHALVGEIADARRAEREDVPLLHAETVKADAALAAAREAFEKAQRARYEAGMAEFRLRDRLREDRRRAEGRLRVTAEPRLVEVRDLLLDAAHNWHHAANAKACFETRGEFMDAHQVMLNREELTAMRTRIDRALERVEALHLVAEPAEDEVLAAVAEGEAASEPVLGVVRRYFA